jgi:hypothetical protein
MFGRYLKLACVAAFATCALPLAAQAQWWQHHPKYLHAMSDIRTAYWLIAHHEQADPVARPEERAALNSIRYAYRDLKDASIVDEKDIDALPPAQMNFYDYRGRLHHALDLLREAHHDVEGEEDDPAARGLRHRALHDIDRAIHDTEIAIAVLMF